MILFRRRVRSRIKPLHQMYPSPPFHLTSHIARYSDAAGSHCSPPLPPAESAVIPFRTCSVHDSCSSEYSVDDILQIILKTRKTWKTLKGRSEAVWPPYLEAIMLKALREYEPVDSRETRILGRYPMRNRFISDYIHNSTGKYRSAKQVGSRLQQLRDTPEGRQLIDVLTRCYHTRLRTGTHDARVPVFQSTSWDDSSSSPSVFSISWDTSSASSSSDSSVTPTSPIMPRFPQLNPRQPVETRMPVYIDILPQQSFLSSMGHAPSSTTASTSSSSSRPSDARHICNIDPTVTFVSPCPVNGKSSYIVCLDGAPVHTEHTMLEYVGPYFSSSSGQAPGNEPALYNTTLVPKYWDVLCEAADPTLYTIVQDVYCLPDLQDRSQRPRPAHIFSATYHFQYPPGSVSSAPAYGQSSAGALSHGSPMTSTFGHQTVHGSIPMGITPSTSASFPIPTAYTSGGSRAPPEAEQNLFDTPFMLDVNFDQFAFDDFVANLDGGSQSTSSSHLYPMDPNTFMM